MHFVAKVTPIINNVIFVNAQMESDLFPKNNTRDIQGGYAF